MLGIDLTKINEVLLGDGQWHRATDLRQLAKDGHLCLTFLAEGNRRVIVPIEQVLACRGRP